MGCLIAAGDPGPPNVLPSAVAALLKDADTVALISLDPRNRPDGPEDSFAGWKALGRTSLAKVDERRAALDSLRRGFAGAGEASGCFEPRHGVRMAKGNQAAEVVICFSCGWAEVREEARAPAWVRIAKAPKAELNAALQAAGVPLAQDVEGP